MEVTKMLIRKKYALSTLMLVAFSNLVNAQDDKTGFLGKIDTTIAHDDNIYRVSKELAESDSYLVFHPEIKFAGAIGKQRVELNYSGDYAKFSNANDADYTDHNLRGKVELEHSLRFSSRFEAGYQKEHEEPGSINRIQLNITEYNKYEQNFLLAGMSYGQTSSIGRITLNYRRQSKDYLNNGLNYLDYDSDQYTSRFTYRIAPKTRIYLEATYSKFDYENSATFELDNTFKQYSAGLTWDFTNKLSGDINIGYQDRNYDLEAIRDINGLAYNGEILWSINSYTQIGFEATRESIDSSLEEAGGFLRTSFGLSLNHKLTELLRLKADAGYSKDELVFSSSREDTRYAHRVSLDYELHTNISLGAYYVFDKRDSTNLLAKYKANIIGINVTLSLDD